MSTHDQQRKHHDQHAESLHRSSVYHACVRPGNSFLMLDNASVLAFFHSTLDVGRWTLDVSSDTAIRQQPDRATTPPQLVTRHTSHVRIDEPAVVGHFLRSFTPSRRARTACPYRPSRALTP